MANWDVVVIGGGPAGLSAAGAVADGGLSCLVIDRMGGGGELMNLGPLQGVSGTPAGPDVAAELLERAVIAGAELGVAEVTALVAEEAGWRVTTDDDSHFAGAIILAVGLAPGSLGIDREQDFEGRGLSHCAACDGPIYAGQPVVVAGADLWAVAEARDLAAIASHVILITQGAFAPAADGFAVIEGCIAVLEGDPGLEAIVVEPAGGGPSRRLPANAVFVQTGRRPSLTFAPEVLACDADGRLLVDATLQSNLPRLFAAGEARAGSDRTLAAAVADGRHAAASASEALRGR